jgi:acyl-coenzyme A thioesterase PaaI-like protein
MTKQAIQDYYHDEIAHCYGCGRLNRDGMHIKSYWEGEESVCHYRPGAHQTGGFPGYVYGGLIASLMDCHSAATASAAKLHMEGFSPGDRPLSRFVSASLKVDFLKPTPIGTVLELRGRVKEIGKRKVIVSISLSADGEVRAKGEAVLVQLPEK